MVETKGAGAAADRWNKAIPGAGASYIDGIDRTKGWKEKAIAGEENYKVAVTEAANAGSRAAGIEAISEQKWKDNAKSKGGERISRGMTAAKGDYASKIGKVISVIEGIQLPARTTDAATNVANRVTPLAVDLQAAKKAGAFR